MYSSITQKNIHALVVKLRFQIRFHWRRIFHWKNGIRKKRKKKHSRLRCRKRTAKEITHGLHEHAIARAGKRIPLQQVPVQTPKNRDCGIPRPHRKAGKRTDNATITPLPFLQNPRFYSFIQRKQSIFLPSLFSFFNESRNPPP